MAPVLTSTRYRQRVAAGDVWQELDEGIFRRRYGFLDQNIGVVVGGEGVLLVDTRSHAGHARELLSDLRLLTPLPVTWVFNTHYHWDHTFGNQVFATSAIWGHVNCRTELLARGLSPVERLIAAYPADAAEYRAVVVTAPTEVFDERVIVDLGNRVVELSYLGPGHTNSDAVLHAGEVTFTGDLVEEGAPPGFGDSFPISWFDTLGLLAAEARPKIVPGHGDTVDVEYLVVSRFDLGWISRQAREAVARGLAVDEIDLTGSPYPEDSAREALARACAELTPAD